MLALRDLLAIPAHIDLVAPNDRFVYRPLAVAEPFGLARTRLFEMADVARALGAQLHVGSVTSVEHDRRELALADGTRLSYDAALIAVGAQHLEWLAGACPFTSDEANEPFGGVLERLDGGPSSSLAIVCPPGMSWTLPLYELALMTASHLAERGAAGVELTVITPEREPLGIFGPGASQMMRELLADRGIRLRADTAVEISSGALIFGSGQTLTVDEIVALPRLQGPRVVGLPHDSEGFIPIDDYCGVPGFDGLYAAGDGTTFPIKQGGLAAQQADIAAQAIAAQLGAPVPLTPFEPVLRAMLLTGIAPIYLRARIGRRDVEGSELEIAGGALWSPSTKIAGRHLSPFLSRVACSERGTLTDQAPSSLDAGALREAHDETRQLALKFAEADARGGDFSSALSWLMVVERIDGVLPSGYIEKQAAWRKHMASN
jgi:sulfide:quinone oxidoreductase